MCQDASIKQIVKNTPVGFLSDPALNLNVVTFSLGLGGNEGVDDVLLKRMANHPLANIFDAANSAGLNAAFIRVASEILSLAR